MDGKRIRAFYANATAWSFDSDAEPHIVALREKQAEEFDAWLAGVKADAWEEGVEAQMYAYGNGHDATDNPYEEDRHVDQ